MDKRIEGLIAAPFSPLDAHGLLNEKIIPEYCQFLEKNNVRGVFVNGTSGEGYSLSIKERMIIAEKWVSCAPKNFKVIIQIGSTSIEDSKEMAKHAQDIGAWAMGSMAPLFFKPKSINSLVSYCAAEASAAPNLPYYYYNIPQITQVDFPMIDFLPLAETLIPNFQGIKYSKVDLADYKNCLEYKQGKFDLPYCQDESLLSALAMGAKGSIGSTYNFMAPLYLHLMKEFEAGNIKKAGDLQLKSIKVVNALANTGVYFSAAKKLMKIIGLDLGSVRLPLLDIEEEKKDLMIKNLEKIGFFDFSSKN